jgi:hypothetical protein
MRAMNLGDLFASGTAQGTWAVAVLQAWITLYGVDALEQCAHLCAQTAIST